MLKILIKIVTWTLFIAIILLGGYYYLHYQQAHPATEDAYVRANIIEIAAQVNGPVATISTQNHANVKKGQLLFTIDSRPFEIAAKKAQADLEQTMQQLQVYDDVINSAKALINERQAELTLAQKEYDRISELVKKSILPISKGDEVTSNLKVAEAAFAAANSQLKQATETRGVPGEENAQLQAAKSALATTKLNLEYTKIFAPASGNMANFDLRKGSMITAQQPLFALIENDNWWVDANFKETALQNIKPGQKVKIYVDMYPDIAFSGVVSSISSGSGEAFSLLPPEDATGNWIKVTQRFPVKIKITNTSSVYPLRVGASCKVSINTNQ